MASLSDRGGRDDRGSRGLGLYIARRMAEAHGGALAMESSQEGGTTFSIRLPRHPPDESSAWGKAVDCIADRAYRDRQIGPVGNDRADPQSEKSVGGRLY
ncbi:MAG: ATP-binding protein [Dehalococcoidia bacterium]